MCDVLQVSLRYDCYSLSDYTKNKGKSIIDYVSIKDYIRYFTYPPDSLSVKNMCKYFWYL